MHDASQIGDNTPAGEPVSHHVGWHVFNASFKFGVFVIFKISVSYASDNGVLIPAFFAFIRYEIPSRPSDRFRAL